MKAIILKIKRWAAYHAARRFFLKQGYVKEKAEAIARDVVKLKYGE